MFKKYLTNRLFKKLVHISKVIFLIFIFCGCSANHKGGEEQTMNDNNNLNNVTEDHLTSQSTSKNPSCPNIIFILTDDMGYGDIALHGNKYIETPNLDALGRESVRFENFYANPLCAATRATLMTGRNFLKTGVWGVHGGRDYMDTSETTIAEVLKANGYHTALMGKWHLGKTNAYLPQNRGFDVTWLATLYRHQNNSMNYNKDNVDLKPGGWSLNPNPPINSYYAPDGSNVQFEGWTTDRLTDLAIDFIQKNNDKQFFLYLPYLAPHGPWEAPEEYINKYRAKGLSESLSTLYGMIDQVDTNVGRLINALDNSGLKENTIVFFMSDNGPVANSGNRLPKLTQEEMNIRNPAGYRGSKGNIWDNGVRVPCFVRWPGQFKSAVIKDIAQVNDIFPTILELTKTSLPEGNLPLDGISLKPLLEGNYEEWKERFLFNAQANANWSDKKDDYDILDDKTKLSYEQQGLSMRNPNLKFVNDRGNKVMFNVKEDLSEKSDVAQQYPEDYLKMDAGLKEWYEGIVQSESSFGIPVFYIGYPGEKKAYVYANAPIRIQGDVKATDHNSSGFSAVGDSQSMLVEILKDGKYEVFFEADVMRPGSVFEISIGEKIIKGTVDLTGKINFGAITLSEGRVELSVTLVSVPNGRGNVLSRFNGIEFVSIPE